MKLISSKQLTSVALTAVLVVLSSDAFAQSRTLAAVNDFIGVNGSGNGNPGCGGSGPLGSGNELTESLNTALGQGGFDDQGVVVAERRAAYRLCDTQTGTSSNGWSGDAAVAPEQQTNQALAFGPEEVFASMDNANASFDLQTANVARRISLVRLARRLDRSAAEQLAKATDSRRPANPNARASFSARGPIELSTTDRSEQMLLALQEGINAGDEVGGSGIGFFLNGRINVIDGKRNKSERGSDGFGGGFTLGADTSLSDEIFAGMALGYTRIDTNFDNSASTSDLDAVTISFYGAYFPNDDLFFDGSIAIAYLGIETSNEIIISDGGPAIPSLKGDADGVNFGFNVGVGYALDLPDLARRVGFDRLADSEHLTAVSFEPSARFGVLYTEIEEFNQRGGDGSIDLEIGKQQTASVTLNLGFRTDYAISTRVGVLTPYFRLAYIHEFVKENDTLKITSVTAPGAPSFRLKPQATDADYANIGLGIAATLGNGFSEFIDYDVIAGHANVTIHQLTAGVRLEF